MRELLLGLGCLLEKSEFQMEETLCLPIESKFLDSEEEKREDKDEEEEEEEEDFFFFDKDSFVFN